MSIFVGTSIFYVRTDIVVLSTLDAIHRHFQWTTYLCFAWIVRRNFVCISFFPSFLVWPLLPNLSVEGFCYTWSHSMTHTRYTQQNSPGWVICPSQRPLADNTKHSQGTYIHDPGGIRNRSPSKLGLQTHAVDRAASGIGLVWISCN
jgi:hypothetical protein